MSYRIGTDTGGTFTDLVFVNDQTGQILFHKVCSTPENPAKAIRQGILEICEKAKVAVQKIETVVHGTTVATNAILERKGVKTALLTTEGFKDVLHIMRQDRPKLYDFRARRPLPLVNRNLRLEVSERMLPDGTILHPLKKKQIQSLASTIRNEQVRSLAICFLHSYANPTHEQEVRNILKNELPNVEFTLSSELIPEIKEYERMSTTVINAYVKPILKRYLQDIVEDLQEIGLCSTFYVMKSNGGMMTAAAAAEFGVHTILSGPAGGVLSGMLLTENMQKPNLITADMGGTSFDVALISGGAPGYAKEINLGGHILKTPMLDIHTIGAGGGSIAWIDSGGALKVGPKSAGAVPGPVAYTHGGTEPTVTDANLVLGRLNPDYFLGGMMAVNPKAAFESIKEKIADPLGLNVLDAAEGILRVINSSMAKGIRYVSVQKGYDPREFNLLAFGGAGPLHAVELAEDLGIPEVIIPPSPGLASAVGLLEADLRQDYVQTFLMELIPEAMKRIQSAFAKLETRAKDFFGPGETRIQRRLDLRYLGQGYELEIPYNAGLKEMISNFHEIHKRSYGFERLELPVQVVNLRVTALRPVKKLPVSDLPSRDPDPSNAVKSVREVYLRGKFYECLVYDRMLLQPGNRMSGPAIIEQPDSTTALFPGNVANVTSLGHLMIHVGGAENSFARLNSPSEETG